MKTHKKCADAVQDILVSPGRLMGLCNLTTCHFILNLRVLFEESFSNFCELWWDVMSFPGFRSGIYRNFVIWDHTGFRTTTPIWE